MKTENYPIGTPVMFHTGEIEGKTMEAVASSPTDKHPDRKVVRIKWEDKSESIENLKDIIALA